MEPPVAKIRPHRTTVHGRERVDPYHWMRDVDDPDVLAYLTAENAYCGHVMKPHEGLRERLYQEIVDRKPQSDAMVPGRWGPYQYYLRTEAGRPYRVHCRRLGEDGAEEVILDLNALAEELEEGAYLDPGQVRVSPDHALLAYGLDHKGDEEYRLHIKELRTGEVLQDKLQKTGGMVAWANDGRTLFYNQRDHAGRPYKIFRHVIGTPQSADEVVVHEPDIKFNLLLSKTLSGGFITAVSRSRSTRWVRALSADDPQGEFFTVTPRVEGERAGVVHHGDRFFIRTNRDAPNFRVVQAPIHDPRPEGWRDVLPADGERSVESIEAFSKHLVVFVRDRGLPGIRVVDLASHETHDVQMSEPTYALRPRGNLDFETTTLRFEYSSPATPTTIFDYDMDARSRVVRKQDQVLGDWDSSRYELQRLWATAPDGVRVPISLLRPTSIPLDGSHPLVLHGYGAYAVNADASFSSDRFSLVDRGVLHAVAHVRGGGELGPTWWEDGRLLAKRNTFTDFIACAEALIDGGYTRSDRLAISGGSAGGLLIGAVINERPDLACAAIASVPFVDVSNSMLDPTLRMTSTEYEEWGDPSDPEQFAYMDGYCPYGNVRRQGYPHLLITCGLHDTRVHFWGPAKWAARLREARTDDRLQLLKSQLAAGHFGPSDRYAVARETAFQYAFLLEVLGVADRGGPSYPPRVDAGM